MYHFAIVALIGLAVWKFVGMLLGFFGKEFTSHVRAFLTLGLGVVGTIMLDYSLFDAWGVAVRNDWMGPTFTGLMAGGMAYVWHYLIGAIEAYGRRNRDEARDIEHRGAPRAA